MPHFQNRYGAPSQVRNSHARWQHEVEPAARLGCFSYLLLAAIGATIAICLL